MARELAAAVSACATVADKGNVPILKTIRIVASGGAVEFTATDTAQTIHVRAACDGDLSCCVDAQALDQKCRAIKSGEVDIVQSDTDITISQGRTKWKIPVMPVADYPAQAAGAVKGKKIEMPETFLSDIAAAVSHADPTRANLMGVLLDGKHMVSTDGKRMAAIEFADKLPRVTLPTQAVNRIALLDGQITAVIGELAATFSTEFVTLRTQLLADPFPDWKRIIPELPHSAIVDRAEFMAAVQRATAIRADDKRIVYVRLTFGDEIEIYSRNSSDEDGRDYVACSGAEPAYVGLNADALRSVLSTMDAETIIVRYQDFQTPIMIESVKSDRQNVRVLMPVRLPAGFAQ